MRDSGDPRSTVQKFMVARRDPTSRSASYDHCFNYFQSFREAGKIPDLSGKEFCQVSCLQLGFYLASWGMYRGSSELHERSAAALVPVVDLIAHSPDAPWQVDVEQYGDQCVIGNIMSFKKQLQKAVPGGHSDVLTSKIMLGVFGCVPAFDRYFKIGSGLTSFSDKSLQRIYGYHNENATTVRELRVNSLDFFGNETPFRYSQAKVIDIIFYETGKETSAQRAMKGN
jgi:hypothetical protein